MAKPIKYCTIQNCVDRVWGHGLCQKHYARQRRNGHSGSYRDEPRFVIADNGCHIYRAPFGGKRYPSDPNTKHTLARVILSQKLNRPLKVGMIPCHTCDNKRCINPDHLYEGTYSDNAHDYFERGKWKKTSEPPS